MEVELHRLEVGFLHRLSQGTRRLPRFLCNTIPSLQQVSCAMAVLQDLSDELLVEIIEFSACDKTTLLNVAAVSDKLNGLAIPILARDIDIYVQTPDQGK